MRLTARGTNIYEEIDEFALITEEVCEIYDKLSKLEDLEDRVGVDLSVLLSLMLDGCYVRDKWANKPGEISRFFLARFPTSVDGFWARYGGAHEEHYFRFCQRGETWALTEEELRENDEIHQNERRKNR